MATIITGAALAGCSRRSAEGERAQEEMKAKPIDEVLREHTAEWMSIPGVVGTGIGECAGEACIRIMVRKKTPRLAKSLPAEVEGYTVDVVETGAFQARDSQSR